MAPSDAASESKPKNDVGFRRTWDKAEYAERVAKRDREEEEDLSHDRRRGVQRDKLIRGSESRDIEGHVGETFLVTKDTSAAQAGGFYCKVCQCQLRDSISYLDHINGKRHQRMMGMSMQVEKSTVAQIRARLADMRRRKEMQQEKEYDFEEKVSQRQSAEEKLKAERRARKKEYKRQKQLAEEEDRAKKTGGDADDAEGQGLDEEQAQLLGFSGFGGGKNN